ncbi:hypothetical protein IV102_13675 [bacterium]|nr:hypothetical protein [bacterium]
MRYTCSTAGQLAAEVVHELNTPLGAMMIAVELAIGSLRNNPEQAFQRLDKAVQAIQQMQHVLAGLTDLAWQQGPEC